VYSRQKNSFFPGKNFGTEEIFYENASGRILVENILADRDLPPFDRPTVDGIAISFNSYEKGLRSFTIKSVQAAGEAPLSIDEDNECIEIMTGAALHYSMDTVIRYEDILINNNIAIINIDIKKRTEYPFERKR
jgi:molybdopterin molybdotransferase